MPVSPMARRVGLVAKKTPGLRRIPVMYLILAGELVLIAREHFELLEPGERRRLIVLLRQARGRPSNLSDRDRRELRNLVAKADPKLFAQEAAVKLSPVRVPKRFRP